MPNFAIALTTLAATVAIAPYAYAVPNVEDVHQTKFDQNALSAEQLQGLSNAQAESEISTTSPSTVVSPATSNFNDAQRNNLNDAAEIFNQLPSENTASDPALEVIILSL
ncbi:MAG: hypothetical protein AAFQ89_07365 [Cyanobacteria bacterium J06626_18]